MNADAFRYLYDYHFSENRKIWDSYITSLSPEQFVQDVNYSYGSVRNQIVHLMNTEHIWFAELRRVDIAKLPDPGEFADRNTLRDQWDEVERDIRAYLASLQDDMLFKKPINLEEDKNLIVWQVLLHVVNHATDHRAQFLRALSDLGVKTGPQDFIFYVYDHM